MARIKHVFDDLTPSRYLSKQTPSSYIRHMRFCRLMTKNTDDLPLLESLNEGRHNSTELEISHLNSEMLHAIRGSFVILLKEVADVYNNNPAKSVAFHVSSFYRFGEQFLKNPYELFEEFNNFFKPIYLGYVNERLAEVPEEGAKIKQLYFRNMRLF